MNLGQGILLISILSAAASLPAFSEFKHKKTLSGFKNENEFKHEKALSGFKHENEFKHEKIADLLRKSLQQLRISEIPNDCQITMSAAIELRDNILGLIELHLGEDYAKTMMNEIEEDYDQDFTSTHFLSRFICRVTKAKSLQGLTDTISEMMNPVDPMEVAGGLMELQRMIGPLEAFVPDAMSYFKRYSEWTKRTNFPFSWPLQGTSVEEFEALLVDGAALAHQVSEHFGDNSEDSMDYHVIAKDTVESQSWAEFLRKVAQIPDESMLSPQHRQLMINTLSAPGKDQYVPLIDGIFTNALLLLHTWDELKIFDLWYEGFAGMMK